jgi:hypothetical protein
MGDSLSSLPALDLFQSCPQPQGFQGRAIKPSDGEFFIMEFGSGLKFDWHTTCLDNDYSLRVEEGTWCSLVVAFSVTTQQSYTTSATIFSPLCEYSYTRITLLFRAITGIYFFHRSSDIVQYAWHDWRRRNRDIPPASHSSQEFSLHQFDPQHILCLISLHISKIYLQVQNIYQWLRDQLHFVPLVADRGFARPRSSKRSPGMSHVFYSSPKKFIDEMHVIYMAD